MNWKDKIRSSGMGKSAPEAAERLIEATENDSLSLSAEDSTEPRPLVQD